MKFDPLTFIYGPHSISDAEVEALAENIVNSLIWAFRTDRQRETLKATVLEKLRSGLFASARNPASINLEVV